MWMDRLNHYGKEVNTGWGGLESTHKRTRKQEKSVYQSRYHRTSGKPTTWRSWGGGGYQGKFTKGSTNTLA